MEHRSRIGMDYDGWTGTKPETCGSNICKYAPIVVAHIAPMASPLYRSCRATTFTYSGASSAIQQDSGLECGIRLFCTFRGKENGLPAAEMDFSELRRQRDCLAARPHVA